MEYYGKHTKNEFKRNIKNMPYNELLKEYNDINLQILKASNMSSKAQNPYDKGQYPVKLLKWKKGLLIQEMQKKTKK